MTSHIAKQRRSFSGAFLIGSVMTLATTFGLAATPAQAQDAGMVSVTGTWTRGGNDTVAWVDLETWKLVTSVEGSRPVGGPEPLPWIPVAGDWDGDGVDSIQMFNPHDWRLVPAERGPVETRVGDPIPWLPVAGDWDGDRIDTVKVVNASDGSVHDLDEGFSIIGFCDPEDWWFAKAGDWDGDGMDTIALYQNPLASSAIWQTVFGDWDGDGIDTQAELHLPTGQLALSEELRAETAAMEINGLFDADGFTFCNTTIKNKKSTYVKYPGPLGTTLYRCETTWEEWSCCLVTGGWQCKVRVKSETTPLCPS